MKKVLLFGDSIMRGVVMDAEGKYKISKGINWGEIEDTLDVKIENHSKMGCTVTKALPIVMSVIQKRTDKDVTAILEYGGNDSDYDWGKVAFVASKTHEPNTPIKDFEATLERIIIYLISEDIRGVLMTLPPIDSEKYFKKISEKVETPENIMYFLGDTNVIYRRQEAYSDAITKLARKYNLDLVDVRREFLMHPDFESLICEDGIHPSVKGEQVITKTFMDYFLDERKEQAI